MAEEAPAAAAVPASTPAKPKKRNPRTVARSSPSVKDLILKVIGDSKERKGVSYPGLKKALAAKGYDVERKSSQLKRVLAKLVENKVLVQAKGTGAAGWFKLNKAAEKPKKKAGKKNAVVKKAAGKKTPVKKTKKVQKVKSTPVKKSKPSAVKRSSTGKKQAPKKSPKKKDVKKPKKSNTPKKTAVKRAAPKKNPPKKSPKPRAPKAAAKKSAKK